ncbi:hydroxyacid dehydrogenase [Ramlibacter sp. AN1133]|uniref:hydroxyacid dehydrogenase n=1 Tax=Ramlibacter sp. AN1133 TaxID=3133429 RepID=UPI0030C2B58F
MRPVVLITHAIHKAAMARLQEEADARVLADPSAAGLLREIGSADALLVRMPIPAEAIRAGRRLRVVARHGVGLDYIPVDVCTELGIPVVFTPDANTESVAEHVVGTMIALAHQVARADRMVRAGRWGERDAIMGIDLRGRTIGIVGVGRIGARVAQICREGFGMQVLGYDPHLDGAAIEARGAQPRTLQALLAEADFVTLHTPSTPQTRHLIDAKAIAGMKRGAWLVNHARGALVDTEALTAALRSGHLSGAAVDVLEVEPPPATLELLQLDNVIVTPHSAALTDEAMRRMGCDAAEDVLRVLRNETPAACANRQVLKGSR